MTEPKWVSSKLSGGWKGGMLEEAEGLYRNGIQDQCPQLPIHRKHPLLNGDKNRNENRNVQQFREEQYCRNVGSNADREVLLLPSQTVKARPQAQKAVAPENQTRKLSFFPTRLADSADEPFVLFDRHETTTTASHGTDDVRETSSLMHDASTSGFLKSSARANIVTKEGGTESRNRVPQRSESSQRQSSRCSARHTTQHASKSTSMLENFGERVLPSFSVDETSFSALAYPASPTSASCCSSSSSSSFSSSESSTYQSPSPGASDNQDSQRAQINGSGYSSFPLKDVSGAQPDKSQGTPLHKVTKPNVELSPLQFPKATRHYSNIPDNVSRFAKKAEQFSEPVLAGTLVSLALPEQRLFLSMMPSFLTPRNFGAFEKKYIPQKAPNRLTRFAAGVSPSYLTQGCHRLQETFYQLAIPTPRDVLEKPTELPSEALSGTRNNENAFSFQNVSVSSPQHFFVLPVYKLLENYLQSSDAKTCQKFIQKIGLSDAAERVQAPMPAFSMSYAAKNSAFTHTPCFVCLPIHLPKNQQHPTMQHSLITSAGTSSSFVEELPSAPILCLLRSKFFATSGRGDRFNDSVSDEVEFCLTDLTAFLETCEKEVKKQLAAAATCSAETRQGGETRIRHQKRSLNPASVIVSALRQHSSLSDAVWTFERLDASSAHTIEVVKLQNCRYSIRNFCNDYLIVEHNSTQASKDEATATPSLVLRQTIDLNQDMISSGWTFNNSFRPFEPLWLSSCSKLLQSPDSMLELSCPINVFETLSHLKHPFQSLPNTLPLYIQEVALVEDLLYCFIGVPGEIIKFCYMEDEISLSAAALDCSNRLDDQDTGTRRGFERGRSILHSTPADPIDWYFSVETSLEGRVNLDSSLVQMAKRILSVSRIYRKICRFVEVHWDVRFGLCSQALVEATKTVLTEFQMRITQLESIHHVGQLSLQKLWFYLQPAASSFQTLEKVVDAVRGQRGGALLNGLTRVWRSISRTDSGKQLCRFLVEQSAVPMTTFLINWLTKGIIDDPHDEFWIISDRSVTPMSSEILQPKVGFVDLVTPWFSNSSQWHETHSALLDVDQTTAVNTFGLHPYWCLKFRIKEAVCVPDFLSSVTSQALDAGKHLNVLASCPEYRHNNCSPFLNSDDSQSLRVLDTSISPFDVLYNQTITDSSRYATSCLAKYMMETSDLTGRLKSIRRFMFFARSDMIFSLLSIVEEVTQRASPHGVEMRMYPVAKIVGRLNAFLDSAVAASSLANDPHRMMFHCTLSHYNIREVSPWFNGSVQHEYITRDVVSLVSGLVLRQPGHGSGVNSSSDYCWEANVPVSNASSYSRQPPALEKHPLLRASSPSYLSDAGAFPLLADAVSSSTQTTSIQRFQELLKYLALSFELFWPLNIIFTRVTVIKYQLLSRLVMQLKFTEKKLAEIWQTQMHWNQAARRWGGPSPPYFASYMLRLRMLHFVRNFIFYITIEVLEPRFHDFFRNLKDARSLDDIINLHEHFLNNCLNETLLTEPNLLRNLSKVLTVCHLFTSTAVKFSLYKLEVFTNEATMQQKQGHLSKTAAKSHQKPKHLNAPLCSMSEEQFGSLVKQYTLHFERNLKCFLILLLERRIGTSASSNSHVHNLLTRLDFNGYYSRHFELNLYSFEHGTEACD